MDAGVLSRMGCAAVVALLLPVLAGCTLPRSGPYAEEITKPAPADYGFTAIPVTAAVTRAARIDERAGFTVGFTGEGPERHDLISAGDDLAITIWENAEAGLVSPTGVGPTPLPNVRVDARGRVFVPYAGSVPAAGRTISQLRRSITARLAGKTVNPQVDVFPVRQQGRTVSVQGIVGTPGVYAIDGPTTRLLAMIARAGGVKDDAERVRIKLRRGAAQGEIWLTDLYDRPINDVHLRAGDSVILERDRRAFTALGAVGKSDTVPFPTRELSLVRALGIAGGLNEQTADPTGVFVFREETAGIARQLGRKARGPVRIAYILDLTRPEGMFLARDFAMRDGDTLYVTTAPYVRWMKILQAIAPVVNFGGAARSVGGI